MLVRTDAHPHKGQILVTTRAVGAGEELLVEAPLMLVPPDHKCSAPPPEMALSGIDRRTWSYFVTFANLSEQVQSSVLAFFADVTDTPALVLRELLSRSGLSEAQQQVLRLHRHLDPIPSPCPPAPPPPSHPPPTHHSVLHR